MISSLASSNILLVSFPWRNLPFSSSPINFHLHFDFSPISQTKIFSSINVEESTSTSASAELVSKNPSNPDSVLICLKNHGFSDAHIEKFIRKHPKVLKMNAEENLQPKMDFFLSIGVKGDDLFTILCRDQSLLFTSLNKRIIPCYEFFKKVLVHDELVVKSLKNSSWIWKRDLDQKVLPNFELLKMVGVPESNIQSFLIRASNLFCLDNAKFSEMVNRAIDMGFDPSSYSFIEAIWYWPTERTWELKAQVCRSWGWSDSDISLALRKSPKFMHKSVEKLTAVMDFLVNKMGCDPSAVATASYVFKLSLKKNIIPKSSVIRVLILKGLIGEEIALNSFMPLDRKRFLERFVFRYLERVPELLDIYKGEVDLSELGFEFEDKLDT